MKLQRTSFGLLVAAALLAGMVAVYEQQQKTATTAPGVDQPTSQRVFAFEEAAIAMVTIETRRPPVTIARMYGQWRLSAPRKVPANEATVAFLTNLLTTTQRDRTLNVSPDRAAEFGLDQPLGTISITLADQKQHKLVLGKPSFDRTFLYALIDPDPQAKELAVSLISPQFANAVDRELAEWQVEQPVEQGVATPSPEASATPSPSPEVTPAASPTGQPTPSPSTSSNPSPVVSPSPQTSPQPEASPAAKP
jgi:Domain of unknown function (DUF4340)